MCRVPSAEGSTGLAARKTQAPRAEADGKREQEGERKTDRKIENVEQERGYAREGDETSKAKIRMSVGMLLDCVCIGCFSDRGKRKETCSNPWEGARRRQEFNGRAGSK